MSSFAFPHTHKSTKIQRPNPVMAVLLFFKGIAFLKEGKFQKFKATQKMKFALKMQTTGSRAGLSLLNYVSNCHFSRRPWGKKHRRKKKIRRVHTTSVCVLKHNASRFFPSSSFTTHACHMKGAKCLTLLKLGKPNPECKLCAKLLLCCLQHSPPGTWSSNLRGDPGLWGEKNGQKIGFLEVFFITI